ncbi:MAG: hypothetical protein ACXVB9_19075 [Bdellovibrionota bacterium]
MKNFYILPLLTIALLSASPKAQANAARLSPALEKEVIELADDMGPDAWDESSLSVKFDAVLFDAEKDRVIVIYESRPEASRRPYKRQKPIVVNGIRSQREIVEQASNGYRSLNQKVANAILESVE